MFTIITRSNWIFKPFRLFLNCLKSFGNIENLKNLFFRHTLIKTTCTFSGESFKNYVSMCSISKQSFAQTEFHAESFIGRDVVPREIDKIIRGENRAPSTGLAYLSRPSPDDRRIFHLYPDEFIGKSPSRRRRRRRRRPDKPAVVQTA